MPIIENPEDEEEEFLAKLADKEDWKAPDPTLTKNIEDEIELEPPKKRRKKESSTCRDRSEDRTSLNIQLPLSYED